MKTELTFDPEFEQLYKGWCNDETMRKMLKLSGVAIDQVDIGAMSHRYFKDSWQEDGTIDHNANSNNLGPINYGLEIAKPTMKLLGLYLLHRYLRKDHSLETANMLLSDVITGEYYVHDASGIGIQIPYSYTAHELVTVWVDGVVRNLPMKAVFDIASKNNTVEHNDNGKSWVCPTGLMVRDGDEWVDVTHVMEKSNVRKMVEIRLSDGSHQIVTDNHPMITSEGEKDASDLLVGDVLQTVEPYYIETPLSVNGFGLTKDLGYLVGMVVGDGWETDAGVFISQKNGTDVRKRIEETLTENGVHFIQVSNNEDRLHISDKRFRNFIDTCDLGHMSENRRLPYFWVNAPKDFLVGMVAGIFDAEGSLGGANKNLPQLRMTSRTAILQVREILAVLGCKSSITAYGPHVREGSFRSKKRMYNLVMKANDGEFDKVREWSEKLYGVSTPSIRGSHKVDERGMVTVQKIVEYPQSIDTVYDITTETGTFTCDGIHSHNCYAWTTMWVAENGIPYGQLPSQPPKHARSFVGQVAEVTMDLSQEFAGAVAPADMLIVYSYFAKKEGLTDKEIENDLQSFVHIMNKQFRPGGQCVDQETEVLTPTGFKNYNTLSVGDDIYTWADGELNIQQVKAVNVYDHDGDMHVYSGRDTIQMVTPNHRILHKVNNSDDYMLSESSALIAQKTPLTYPVAMLSDNREDYDISDDMLKLCVFVLTDGHLRKTCGGIRFYKSENRWGGDEFRATCERLGYEVTDTPRDGEGSFAPVVEYYLNSTYAADVRSLLGDSRDIPDWMFNLSKRQAALVIDTWAKLDGYSDGDRMKLQCDTYDIADALQHICFLAGKGSRITERTIGNNVTPTIYVIPYNRVNKSASCKDVVHYTGKVWCPSTDDGIVVFRKDGKLFISGNSPFTNLSILDHDNIESLFGDAVFPDGSKLDIDYAMHVQDVFLQWFSEGNPSNGEPYRFPVTTMNVTKDEHGKVIDLDFLFKLAVYNTKLGAFNIHSGERAKLAMCPLHEDEQVLIKNHKGIFDSRIGDLGNHDKTDYEVMINGRFESGKFIKTHTDSFVEVTLSNGHKFKTTPEHLNVTKRGTLMSKDLVVGDLIPFSLIPYVGEGGDYRMGLMVGAYLGDGSVGGRTVTFSLNHTTKAELFDILESYINNTLGGKTRTVERDNVKLLETNSDVVHGILSQFVYGNDKALKKGMLPEIYEKSLEFRKGVYDGYYATDGGNKDRIYTSSERMVHDLSVLAATMGTVTNIKTVDERDGRYSEKPNYCVKTYSRDGLLNRSYAGVWESDVDKAWFYITDVKSIDNAGNAYCFEMNTDEHLFQLSNGMITHNCRFINDPETMSHFKTDTFGNGGLNIGSHRIVAMNMPRYAYRANNIEEFLDILGERMERAAKILVTHRERILKKRIEQGFLRAFQVGIASLDTMFSTIGVNGMPECIEALGEPLIADNGYSLRPSARKLQIEILKFMDNKRLELSKRYGVPFNIEEIPGESAAINMRNKDAILFEDNVHPNRLYSNQFIPVTYPVTKKDRIEATGEFMKYMTGGSILHMNVDEAIKDPMVMFELMKYMIESGVDHFAINYGFSRCKHGHSSSGIHDLCPECMAEIQDYLTRIVGYFVPVSSWNKVRREHDFGQRKLY